MTTRDDGPHKVSSLTFVAIREATEQYRPEFARRARLELTTRALERVERGYSEVSDADIEYFAQLAESLNREFWRKVFDRGIEAGIRAERARLGLPEETARTDEDTARLEPCPLNGQPCTVPARLKR